MHGVQRNVAVQQNTKNMFRRFVARRFNSSISSPPPSNNAPKKQLTQQEIAAAFQKLGENLKIDKGVTGNANVFAQSQQARDMRDLVKKRHLDQFKGTRFTEVDIKQWFVEMDNGRMLPASEDTQMMFKRLYAKYKCVI